MPDEGFARYDIKNPEDHSLFSKQLQEHYREEVELFKRSNCNFFLLAASIATVDYGQKVW